MQPQRQRELALLQAPRSCTYIAVEYAGRRGASGADIQLDSLDADYPLEVRLIREHALERVLRVLARRVSVEDLVDCVVREAVEDHAGSEALGG